MPEPTNPDISFVVPTYGEADNLALLIEHIKNGLADSELTWELIIANDDSGDNTAAVCAELAQTEPLRLLNRTTDRGLALAVIDGAQLATGTYLVVMDADQSHPAATVPTMVKLLQDDQADFVIGSRKVAEAKIDSDWPIARHLATFGATTVVLPLVNVQDPMAGFFALRQSQWPTTPLHPIGFKIGLELIVRGGFEADRIVEVPITFVDRKVGVSKMGLRELNNYIRHVLALYCFRWPFLRILMHGGVGTTGLIIDICFYYGLQAAGIPHLSARMISFWPAITNNWWLNRIYTYSDRPKRSKLRQLVEFSQVTLLGFAVNTGIYYLLTTQVAWFAEHKLVALVSGVVVGLLVNFLGSNLFVFGKQRQERPKSSA